LDHNDLRESPLRRDFGTTESVGTEDNGSKTKQGKGKGIRGERRRERIQERYQHRE
jgi:hypothetical protein